MGPVTAGNFLFVSLIAGDLAADVGCPFALHDKALLVVVSVYVGMGLDITRHILFRATQKRLSGQTPRLVF